ncbi:DUF6397 family protein [Streptomyces sp. NPDC050534]|uniref:DUF6397 family protein n=1 Tax=Streptomyces sp. NPDC050534 TaxID=3365625 RepID=UPI003793E707
MSGNTVTHGHSRFCTLGRAARELGLKRGELDLAVNLGHIRAVPDEGGGGLRVARTEIDRLCAEEGYPEALKKRVEAVGTREGADLLVVSHGRFTRLARLGIVVPVRFYLNRYRAVVWLYLAEELRQFAADETNAPLLGGRTPSELRARLETGLDLRPRTWRGRYLGFLRRQAGDHPWACAAAVASLLDAVQVAETVQDPYERAHLNRFRPRPSAAHGAPGSPAAQLAESLAMAQDPDEISWLRSDLAQAVSEARTLQPAPRPASGSGPTPTPSGSGPTPTPSCSAPAPPRKTPAPTRDRIQPVPDEPPSSRGLMRWLRRGTA